MSGPFRRGRTPIGIVDARCQVIKPSINRQWVAFRPQRLPCFVGCVACPEQFADIAEQEAGLTPRLKDLLGAHALGRGVISGNGESAEPRNPDGTKRARAGRRGGKPGCAETCLGSRPLSANGAPEKASPRTPRGNPAWDSRRALPHRLDKTPARRNSRPRGHGMKKTAP